MTFRHPRSGTEGTLREALDMGNPNKSDDVYEIHLTRTELLSIVGKIDSLSIAFRGRSLNSCLTNGSAETRRR